MLLIIAGLAFSLAVTKVRQLVICWGVIVGTGTGMTAPVLGATLATRWFSERRGLVLGLMTASNATGQLVFPPMVADVTERHGWPIAAVGAAGMLAVIGVVDFIGTILSGWLSDRYDNRRLLFWYYGLRGLSLLYLPFTVPRDGSGGHGPADRSSHRGSFRSRARCNHPEWDRSATLLDRQPRR